MICRACQLDNPDSSVFCKQCGLRLELGPLHQCNNCGAWNTFEEPVCYQCGAELSARPSSPDADPSPASTSRSAGHLAQRILAEKQALTAKGVPEGERKTVTALFSDIKGSTDMMQDLDPDDAREIVDPSLQLMIDAVQRYQGYVVASQGDGIFALFGAPIAIEDHALRAIRASISMQENIAAYRERLIAQGKPPLEIRIGLNTGEMILRPIPKGDLQFDYNAIGHAVNLAARVQTFASPGGIAVGESTFKLAQGYFEFKLLGPQHVKGVRDPVEIREVVGAGRLHSRFEVSEDRGLVPLVGRDEELSILLDARDKVLRGQGQIVAVVGEPGVGKSRLFHEFKSNLKTGWRIVESSAASHAKQFPYVPLRALLTNYFDLAPGDLDDVRSQKVLDKCRSLDEQLVDAAPYICSLLGIVGPEDARVRQITSEIRQRLMHEAVIRLLNVEGSKSPLALIVEDVHWLDARSEEFLVAFAGQLNASQILLLVNYRPEYSERWAARENFTEIGLKSLSGSAAQSFLSSILGDGPQLAPVKQFVGEVTEGNPFFAEELVRDLVERGVLTRDENGTFAGTSAEGLSALKVPNTVQGVLASRIDALAPSYKELLQRLSIFGREFSSILLPPFADRDANELERELHQLQNRGFIYLDDSAHDAAMRFKHSLTQQVAYNSMTADRRKVMHERAGRAIEDIYANRLQDHYAELAFHFSRSANLEKGIEYLSSAGNQLVKMAAIKQAIGHYQEGLNLLASLPAGSARESKELTLRFSWASALWQSEGPTNREVLGLLNRVMELVKPETDPTLTFGSLQSLVMMSCVEADYAEASQRCQRLMKFAKQMNFPIITMLALFVRSNVLMLLGDLDQAQRDFKEALTLYEPVQAMLWESPIGLVAYSLAPYGPLQCIMGHPDQALNSAEQTIALARDRSTKFNLAYAIYFAGFVHLLRGDKVGAQRCADEAIAIASEYGFENMMGGAKVLRGWVLAREQNFDAAVAMIREGIGQFEKTSGKIWHATLNAVLVDVLASAERFDEASQLADETIRFAKASGERVTLAELWRSKGLVHLAHGDTNRSEAEKCLRQAMSVAHEQGARVFELRAANALCSMLDDAPRRDEAGSVLAEIYRAFTEGFETPDLLAAKALLAEQHPLSA